MPYTVQPVALVWYVWYMWPLNTGQFYTVIKGNDFQDFNKWPGLIEVRLKQVWLYMAKI